MDVGGGTAMLMVTMSTDHAHHYTLQAEAGHVSVWGYAPTLIYAGQSFLHRNAPDVLVKSSIDADGNQTIDIDGRLHLGKASAELRVLQILRDAVARSGAPDVRCEPGTPYDDHAKIDGYLVYPGDRRQPVQIVSVPCDRGICRSFQTGDTRDFRLSLDDAAKWVDAAIHHKVSNIDSERRSGLLLALGDPTALLAHPKVLEHHGRHHKDPSEHGFAELWLVGQSVERTARLA
jgi:hypothetical protein